MCYRYTLRTLAAAAEIFQQLAEAADGWTPRYNVALTQRMPVITRRSGTTAVEAMSFGILPPPRSPGEKPAILGNARSETLLQKPSFRAAAARRRCLVPADGFYEWEKRDRERLPHYFTLRDGKPFFLAAIWEPARDDAPPAFSIVTTAANAVLSPIHDRMPVMLGPNSGPLWLGDEPLAPARVAQLCRPLKPELMTGYRVGEKMNNVRYEAPDCVAPVEGRQI